MTNVIHALVLRLQESDGSGGGFLSSIPTDPASIFVLILVVITVGWVIYVGRSKGGDEEGP